jgi:hypothetical protein
VPHVPDLSGSALDDRYELHAVIGEGAFGRVYAGRDRRLARSVAVKVIKPWWTDDPEWVAMFERETQLLARVSHPGIVQIFDVGHAPPGLYYVSELVDGENLASRLRRGRLPAWEACGIAVQLCRALARAHAQRIVHRDVKPANILLSTQGRVKVGDFGVARLAEGSTDDAAATIVGTPRYMAPEQGRGLPTTPATDVYSVGVVLYEMLAGRPPFAGDSVVELALRHVEDPPPPLSVRLPRSLVQVAERALAKDPAERFADGAEMAEALVAARKRSASARSPLVPARTRAPAHRPRAMLVPAGTTPPAAPAPHGRVNAPPPARRGRVNPPPPPRRPDDTRPAPEMSPRRNVNPPARRRAVAALGLVVTLIAAMVAGAAVLAAPARTRVPALTRLHRGAAGAAARRRHLVVAFGAGYDATAAPGIVIGQRPRAGASVVQGTMVHLVLSRGPAPVKLPRLSRQSVADAQESLKSLGLHTTVRRVPAPGITPGTVTGQSPGARTMASVGSLVTLSVAETPQWRPLTTFTGGRSGVVHITGERWRIVYRMAYQGTCTWIIFCSGPNARVVNTTSGATVSGFGLGSGSGQLRDVSTGPGSYEIEVTPGDDDARWSVQVEDYF